MAKCETCEVYAETLKSPEPACCKWFIDNVVIGDRSVDECTVYEPVKPDDTEAFNDFESEEDDSSCDEV